MVSLNQSEEIARVQSTTPLVAIVVLSWNNYDLTADCLRSLLRLDYPDYRIIVVDNKSTDDSIEKLRQDFGEQVSLVLNSENLGFTGGNNVGIRCAMKLGANFVMLLNNDTVVDPHCLDHLVNVLQSDPHVGAVTPKIYFLDNKSNRKIWSAGGRANMWLGLSFNRGWGQRDVGQFDRVEEVDFGTGCCLMTRPDVLQQVGLFNEDYFAYFEDADWSLRAREMGFRIIYVPQAKIWHAVGSSSAQRGRPTKEGRLNPFIHYLLARNHLWFIRSYSTGLKWISALFFYFIQRILFYMIVFLLLRRWQKLKELLRGFMEGMTRLPRSGNSFLSHTSSFNNQVKSEVR